MITNESHFGRKFEKFNKYSIQYHRAIEKTCVNILQRFPSTIEWIFSFFLQDGWLESNATAHRTVLLKDPIQDWILLGGTQTSTATTIHALRALVTCDTKMDRAFYVTRHLYKEAWCCSSGMDASLIRQRKCLFLPYLLLLLWWLNQLLAAPKTRKKSQVQSFRIFILEKVTFRPLPFKPTPPKISKGCFSVYLNKNVALKIFYFLLFDWVPEKSQVDQKKTLFLGWDELGSLVGLCGIFLA